MIHKNKDIATATTTTKATTLETMVEKNWSSEADELLRKITAYQRMYEITMDKLNELLLKDLDKPKKLGGM